VAFATLAGLLLSGGDARVGAVYAATCGASPGAGDYCEADSCGPCAEGEGDCDPGECQAGLECVEEGSIDRCRAAGSATSNLQVKLGGVWKGICCNGDVPEVSDGDCFWTEYDRTLMDVTAGLELDCPEGDPADCEGDSSGERLHGIGGGDLDSSILLPEGGPVYPDGSMETCVYVTSSGELATRWTGWTCPSFRLQ
jgi:hypothetical protein